MRPRSSLCLGLGVAIASLVASAASAGDNEDAARRAFEAGEDAAAAGRHEEACAHYRTSLDLARESGPLARTARCDAREGKIKDAIAKLDEALLKLPPDSGKRPEYQAERAELVKRLARVVFAKRPGAGDVRVLLDGRAAPPWDQTSELDPGAHVVRVETSPPEERSFDLAPGSSTRIEVPFGPALTGEPPVTESAGPSGWLIAGIVSLSVAGVGAVATAATSAIIYARDQDAAAACPGTPRSPACLEAIDEGEALLTPNLALWITTGVAAAAGLTFVIVDRATAESRAPDPGPSARLELVVRPQGLALTGSF